MLWNGSRGLLALTATIYKFDIDLADADRRGDALPPRVSESAPLPMNP